MIPARTRAGFVALCGECEFFRNLADETAAGPLALFLCPVCRVLPVAPGSKAHPPEFCARLARVLV